MGGGDVEYRPAHPEAYGGRPRLPLPGPALVTFLALALLWVVTYDGSTAWRVALVPLVAFGLVLGLRRPPRRGTSPFVVDEPGVFVGRGPDGNGDGVPHLVRWAAIGAVVVLEPAERRSRRHQAELGLRLRARPEVVSDRRRLDGWSIDRARLERAVARFAPPDVRVVELPVLPGKARRR